MLFKAWTRVRINFTRVFPFLKGAAKDQVLTGVERLSVFSTHSAGNSAPDGKKRPRKLNVGPVISNTYRDEHWKHPGSIE